MRVVAVSLGREFDTARLERLLPGKMFVRWEEPILLDVHGMETYVFAFGTVVFFDYKEETARAFLERIREAVEEPDGPYREEFVWEPVPTARGRRITLGEAEVWVSDEAVYGPLDAEGRKILALVLAQSASLRRVESKVDVLLEKIDSVLEELLGKPLILSVRGARASLIEALRVRSNLLNDLLILEKPPATWEDESYERFFERLRYVFEIDERYSIVSKKLSSVVETAELASELVSDSRFLVLEFLIVLFFLLELVSVFFGR